MKATLLFTAPLCKIEQVPAVIEKVAAYLGERMLEEKVDTDSLQLHLKESLNPVDRSTINNSLPDGIGIVEFMYEEAPREEYLVVSL